VPRQREETSTSGGIPELNDVVIEPGREACAIGREGHSQNRTSLAFQRGVKSTRVGIPKSNGVVIGSGCKKSAIGREGYGLN
jgi:hypothetical protein